MKTYKAVIPELGVHRQLVVLDAAHPGLADALFAAGVLGQRMDIVAEQVDPRFIEVRNQDDELLCTLCEG